MNALLAVVITTTYLLVPPDQPPLMCFDPEHAMDSICAGTQQYYPPGYNREDPNTWYRCWYSREAC